MKLKIDNNNSDGIYVGEEVEIKSIAGVVHILCCDGGYYNGEEGYRDMDSALASFTEHYAFTTIDEEETMSNNNKSDGIFTGQMIENMGIKRVIFNDEATIVFLNDGRKGVAVQSTKDEADRVIGLAMAYTFAVATDGNKSQFKKNVEQLKKHGGFGN
jgi:hypothetical protein